MGNVHLNILGPEASAGKTATAVGERTAGVAAEAGGDQPVHLPPAGAGQRSAGGHTNTGSRHDRLDFALCVSISILFILNLAYVSSQAYLVMFLIQK